MKRADIILSNDPIIKYLFPDGSERFYQREINLLVENGYSFVETADGLWRAVKLGG